MPELKTTINVALAGGPAIAVDNVEQLQAYDVIEVEVLPGGTALEADLQPVSAKQMSLMLIRSDRYGDKIGYVASDGTTDSDPVKLHGPHCFSRGMLELFGHDVTKLKFKNELPAPAAGEEPKTAKVQVIVGRIAAP
jgi:hypothetical protein